MEKEKAARQAKEEASRREEQARLDMEERKKAADSRGQTAAEWRKWTDRQKWIKGNIVEVVKADREVKAGLRMGMRLMTRGLGQVVNTKESIVRVVGVAVWTEADVDHRHRQDLDRPAENYPKSYCSCSARRQRLTALRLPLFASLQSFDQASRIGS